MAINSLDFRTKFTDGLDKALTQASVTSGLLDPTFKAHFIGAKTVSIPDIDFAGLLNYDRDSGFTRGAVTVDRKTYTLTQDRARTFSIDREDMDEVGISALAGQLMGEFVRTEVAPEVDAYTLSAIAAKSAAQSHMTAETATAANVFTQLTDCICGAQDAAGNFGEELVAFVNSDVWKLLMTSSAFTKQITVSDFKKGDISTKVYIYNDAKIIPVTKSRMKSGYTFATTTGGGFTPASGAVDVQMLVLPKKACSLVRKSEKVRIFEPDQNQTADAYKFDYRTYYDALFINSYKDTIYGTKVGS